MKANRGSKRREAHSNYCCNMKPASGQHEVSALEHGQRRGSGFCDGWQLFGEGWCCWRRAVLSEVVVGGAIPSLRLCSLLPPNDEVLHLRDGAVVYCTAVLVIIFSNCLISDVPGAEFEQQPDLESETCSCSVHA
jgi:hypothetical protein